jgi:hypothetical protein
LFLGLFGVVGLRKYFLMVKEKRGLFVFSCMHALVGFAYRLCVIGGAERLGVIRGRIVLLDFCEFH